MRLLTFDKEIITINNDLVKYSNFLANLPTYDEEVKLEDKSCLFNIMLKIVEFLSVHDNFQKQNTDMDYVIRWNNRFFDVSDDILFKILAASNFLDIHELFELSCKEVANIIKRCNTPADIRERFNIKTDATPKEQEEVKQLYFNL
tara:strand:- start:111 stop:548 length:438 start_codon:yes stop_codon:yes gene_type:complete